jgi:hypothetical protein
MIDGSLAHDLESIFGPASITDSMLEDTRLPSRPQSITRKLKREMIDRQRRTDLAEIVQSLPAPGISQHIITHGKFDFYDILPRILDLGEMHDADVTAATWCANRRCALDLLKRIKTRQIGSIKLIVGLYLKRREQAVFSTLANGLHAAGQELLATECHAKIITIQHDADFITIEGSANWTSNPRIEQFTITNDRELHDFHRGWIDAAFDRANQQ